MIPCHACLTLVDAPYVVDAQERELCESCAHECALCGKGTDKDDRLPWLVDSGERKHVHFMCVSRLQNALGMERAAILIGKRGPAFTGKGRA